MVFLLDTNICIYFFKGQFQLIDKFRSIGSENFAISEITLLELLYGAEKSQQVEKNREVVNTFANNIQVLPISPCLSLFAQEKARLTSMGKPVSDFDLFIGTTAVVNDLTMVTRNVREFERINGIRLENWIDN